MPLTDDDFVKVGKPEAYTKIIEELIDAEEKEEVEYELDIDFDEEEE